MSKKRQESTWNDILRPIFEDLEKIHNDYTALLRETCNLLPSKDTAYGFFNKNARDDLLLESLPDESAAFVGTKLTVLPSDYQTKMRIALDFLSERRLALEPLRMKTRELLRILEDEDTALSAEARDFVASVANYFRYSSAVDENPEKDYYAIKRSITAKLERFLSRATGSEDPEELLSLWLMLNKARSHTRDSWQDVCRSYAVLTVSLATR